MGLCTVWIRGERYAKSFDDRHSLSPHGGALGAALQEGLCAGGAICTMAVYAVVFIARRDLMLAARQ